MKKFIREMQSAIDYIEAHLEQRLDCRAVAARAFLSPFYFQRIFREVCGMTLSEYIRGRRLTVAGQEILRENGRVLDTALRYGYDSPDGFSRAFQRFHGVLPSQIRDCGQLRRVLPIQLKDLEDIRMEYRIEEKPAFTVMGVVRSIESQSSYQEIPAFWQELFGQGGDCALQGRYGVCIDGGGETFEYMIADDYVPWATLPEGFRTYTVPSSLWAVFPCRGPLPGALQRVNTHIWKEWIPGNGQWRMAGSFNLEVYAPLTENPEDNYAEIWVPVCRA